MRSHGLALGYSILAYKSFLKGLDKITVEKEKMEGELEGHWEVLGEPIQMVMRKRGVGGAYEKMKEMTRGMKFIKIFKIFFVEFY